MNKLLFICVVACGAAYGQTYNLQQLLKENKLELLTGKKISVSDSTDKPGVFVNGMAILKGVQFSSGTIEVDIRGRDVFQRSFIGVIFHGVDSVTYDMVYFRPFNFHATDPERKVHQIQYVSHPEYTWHRLRQEHHNVYEKAVTPIPADASDWFHARIDVKADGTVSVFVNGSEVPSISIMKLNSRKTGFIGLCDNFIGGDFANLVIRK